MKKFLLVAVLAGLMVCGVGLMSSAAQAQYIAVATNDSGDFVVKRGSQMNPTRLRAVRECGSDCVDDVQHAISVDDYWALVVLVCPNGESFVAGSPSGWQGAIEYAYSAKVPDRYRDTCRRVWSYGPRYQ